MMEILPQDILTYEVFPRCSISALLALHCSSKYLRDVAILPKTPKSVLLKLISGEPDTYVHWFLQYCENLCFGTPQSRTLVTNHLGGGALYHRNFPLFLYVKEKADIQTADIMASEVIFSNLGRSGDIQTLTKFAELFKTKKLSSFFCSHLAGSIAQSGNIEALKWYLYHPAASYYCAAFHLSRLTMGLMIRAADFDSLRISSNLKMLQFLMSELDCEPSPQLLPTAARLGDLPTLKYFYDNPNCLGAICLLPALVGLNIDVIEFLISRGDNLVTNEVEKMFETLPFSIVKRMNEKGLRHINGEKYQQELLYYALLNPDRRVLEYCVKEIGYKMPHAIYFKLATSKMQKNEYLWTWLDSHGAKLDQKFSPSLNLWANTSVAALKNLVKRGFEITEPMMRSLLEKATEDVCVYAAECLCPDLLNESYVDNVCNRGFATIASILLDKGFKISPWEMAILMKANHFAWKGHPERTLAVMEKLLNKAYLQRPPLLRALDQVFPTAGINEYHSALKSLAFFRSDKSS